MVPIFKSLIRPILEYANAVWCPQTKKDIRAIEKVQRHFTKRVFGMKDMSYSQRLATLKLPSLEFRRVRGDLIETYKIMTNIYDPETTKTLISSSSTNNLTGSHKFKIFKKRINSNSTRYQKFFTNRITNIWNKLPDHVVKADTVNSFKNCIDKHFNAFKYMTDLNELYIFYK